MSEWLKEIEWSGGGYEDDPLDYYDDGARASGFCPCCGASESRGHHPGCELAAAIGSKTVTSKQAAAARRRAQAKQWAAERAEKAKREAEWQAHLATLTPEARAEEERKRASQLECARAHADSMERMFLFATDASPLTKLLGLTQKTGVTFHHVEDKP